LQNEQSCGFLETMGIGGKHANGCMCIHYLYQHRTFAGVQTIAEQSDKHLATHSAIHDASAYFSQSQTLRP
jgi:hypothetical protein